MVYLEPGGKEPLYEQLYRGLKEDITAGRMPKGTMLKSLRVMERELAVSRNTVDRAYAQLLAEGYISAVHGTGYFVEDIARDFSAGAEAGKTAPAPALIPKKTQVKYDFEYDSIESGLFPWTKWKKYVDDALLTEASGRELSYESGKGSLALRRALCGFLFRHRGVSCDPEQMIICAGTQYAMEILTSLLPPDRNRFAYEEPGYAAMRHFIESKAYVLTSIPVVETGVSYDVLKKSRANLLYITPSHQFPTGTVTSISTRNKLLHWANKRDAYIIENDYDSEFRYGMIPIPSLQSLDKGQRVVYMNTLSKILSPSVRCAFLILPWKLVALYEKKYRWFNSALPSYHQNALAQMIEDGALERHLRKIAVWNEKKYHILADAIETHLAGAVRIVRYPAGVHTLIKIAGCKDQERLIRGLEQAGVRIYSIKRHCHDAAKAYENIFLMGFNSMSERDIISGCKRMAAALAELN
ncbi:MAG: PLP-dependent aminotransferase family protein [Gracilibacteraceae bacterium]|nr:PLP-dependent aminotransferase family protein [Gracilibacteraceae bacterium]